MFFGLNKTATSSYRHLAIIFFMMVTILTIVRGVFHDSFGNAYLKYIVPLVLPVIILFFVFMIRLIKNLGVNERFVQLIIGFLVSAIVIRLLTIFFISGAEPKFAFSLLSSMLLLVMQSTCVYFMCVNLFIEMNPIQEKLWASVCVYFMIGATFGTVYSLLLTINPGALGIELTRLVDIHIMGLVYSMNVISGFDPIYENTSETIRMTAVLESIFSMLFMVILIGRLLGSKD